MGELIEINLAARTFGVPVEDMRGRIDRGQLGAVAFANEIRVDVEELAASYGFDAPPPTPAPRGIGPAKRYPILRRRHSLSPLVDDRERAAIDTLVARTNAGRRGAWARDVLLAAVRADLRPPAPPQPGSGARSLTVSVDDMELEAISGAAERSGLPRRFWCRGVLLAQVVEPRR